MESIRVLVAVGDSSLAASVVKQLTASFSQMEVVMDVALDGKRALSDFKAGRPLIVVISADLPGVDGPRLAEEISKLSGETSIFILGNAPASAKYEVIALPITSWQKAIERILSGLPEHVKSMLGINDRDAAMIAALTVYGERYVVTSSPLPSDADLPFVMIPDFSTPNPNESGLASVSAAMAPTSQKVMVTPDSSNAALTLKTRPWLTPDLILTVLLVIAALALRFWTESERLISLQNIVNVLAIVSVAGITLGRSIERISLRLK